MRDAAAEMDALFPDDQYEEEKKARGMNKGLCRYMRFVTPKHHNW